MLLLVPQRRTSRVGGRRWMWGPAARARSPHGSLPQSRIPPHCPPPRTAGAQHSASCRHHWCESRVVSSAGEAHPMILGPNVGLTWLSRCRRICAEAHTQRHTTDVAQTACTKNEGHLSPPGFLYGCDPTLACADGSVDHLSSSSSSSSSALPARMHLHKGERDECNGAARRDEAIHLLDDV